MRFVMNIYNVCKVRRYNGFFGFRIDFNTFGI